MHGLMMDMPLADQRPDPACGPPPRRGRDRVEDGGGRRQAPLHLPRGAPARAQARERAQGPGRRHARPGRDAGLERLPALRDLLRGRRLGRGDPHHQPAPVPGPDRLHREPRRGQGRVLRPDLRAAGREARAAAEVGEALRRDDRPRAHAQDFHPRPALLRGARRGGIRELRMAELRRAHRRLPLLHVGDHRQSERRALHPPLDHPARLCRGAARRAQRLGARRDPAGGADVPRQRLGDALQLRAHRREARVPGPAPRRQEPARALRKRRSHDERRRAHRVAGPAQLHEGAEAQVHDAEARGDRRLGLPAGDDPRLPGRLRRRGAARLGNDRDEPARHRVHLQGASI